MFRYCKIACLLSLLALGLAFVFGGFKALSLALLLGFLEISLSVDNAILNAATLKTMDALWRKRFLFWGILIAVFVVRFWLPLWIVAVSSRHTIGEIFRMALESPALYAQQLNGCKANLFTFGGLFLSVIFFDFFLKAQKKYYPLVLALLTLTLRLMSLMPSDRTASLIAGLGAIGIFMSLKALKHYLEYSINRFSKQSRSMVQFLYLEILDASFSLDGVMGAFALTQDVLIIFIGLGIGALFVRSLTLYFVEKSTLERYIYLEQGAHYALGILAAVLLLDSIIHVPAIITGSLGIGVIIGSLYASGRYAPKKISSK